MKAELVVIGNEVLKGFTVNTNASFIGQELLNLGYLLQRQTVLPDDENSLAEGLTEALNRNDLIITTGGLGPTIDDITRKVAADLFTSDFTFDPSIAKDLADRYGKDYPTLKDQATVPTKAMTMSNSVGTAPGFIFDQAGKVMIMLPGVPYEMKAMFLEHALPYIQKKFPLTTKTYKKILRLFELPEHAIDPLLRELRIKYPTVDIGIYPSLGVVSVHFAVSAINESQAFKLLENPFNEVETTFATNCFRSESGLLEEAIQHVFTENQWTLSLAESCTGGTAASKLTSLPGASNYFVGSVVAYANSVKSHVLNVPEKMIQEHGAVSEEVVSKMVEGVIELTGSDFGLAITGVAGPAGGTSEKPIGTVWCAVCRKGQIPHTWKLKGRGTREMIIGRCVNSLFSHLLIYTKETSLL